MPKNVNLKVANKINIMSVSHDVFRMTAIAFVWEVSGKYSVKRENCECLVLKIIVDLDSFARLSPNWLHDSSSFIHLFKINLYHFVYPF